MQHRHARRRSPQRTFTYVALATVALVALGLIFLTSLDWYIIWLLAWSAATFMLYGYDKQRAQRGGGRVPEIVLHGMALAGGAGGAWAGMFGFRHKVRKQSFWAVLIIASLIQLALLFFFVL
jgi:uncharacterized membrane protein YsdA (DUF1294 family)